MSKDTLPIEEEVPIGERHHSIFSGTTVTYGRGRVVITATGMHTEIEAIAGLLKRTAEETTPLQKELARVGKLPGIVVLIIAAVMIATILVFEDVRGFSQLFEATGIGGWSQRSRCAKATARG